MILERTPIEQVKRQIKRGRVETRIGGHWWFFGDNTEPVTRAGVACSKGTVFSDLPKRTADRLIQARMDFLDKVVEIMDGVEWEL